MKKIADMKDRIIMIAGIVAAGALVTIAAANSKSGVTGILDDGAAFRSAADIASDEYHYFDSEAVALSSTSNEDSNLREEAIEAANIINDMREDAGLDPLDWDLNLEQVADVRAEEAADVFSHTRPNGQAWNTVNSDIQGGENLAFGFDEAQDVVDAWEDSPTHYDNMMYGDFTKGSIAVYQGDDGVWTWSHQFGY